MCGVGYFFKDYNFPAGRGGVFPVDYYPRVMNVLENSWNGLTGCHHDREVLATEVQVQLTDS